MKTIDHIITGALAVFLFVSGMYIGSSVASHAELKYREMAISNAVEAIEETRVPLTCKDNHIIEAVKRMAENGIHVKGYELWLDVNKRCEPCK